MIFDTTEENEFVNKLLKDHSPRMCQRGDFLYRQGESPRGLYFVKSGLVGLLRTTASGQDSLLRIFKPMQFFGHRSLFTQEQYHGSTRALDYSEIIFCPQDHVFREFDAHPRAYFFLARALAKELRRAETRSVMISEGDIIERVSSALILFKKLLPDHMWTRTEIANYCASRTPTVIKALGKLEEMGAIQQDRREIQILDEEKLLSFLD